MSPDKLTREEIETRKPADCFVVFISPQKFHNERRVRKACSLIAGIVGGLNREEKEAIQTAIDHSDRSEIDESGKAVVEDAPQAQSTSTGSGSSK